MLLLDHPELAVYLLFLPILLYFILPHLMVLTRLLLKVSEHFMDSLKGRPKHSLNEKKEAEESRKDPRFGVTGVLVDVTDGTNYCTGLACDISRVGISLMGLPEKIMHGADRLSIIIKGQEGHFPMYFNPQWTDKKDASLKTGGSLENIPKEWEKFVAPHITAA